MRTHAPQQNDAPPDTVNSRRLVCRERSIVRGDEGRNTKLTRGLTSETAAGFRSRRGLADLRQAAQKLGMNPSDAYLNAVEQIITPLANAYATLDTTPD